VPLRCPVCQRIVVFRLLVGTYPLAQLAAHATDLAIGPVCAGHVIVVHQLRNGSISSVQYQQSLRPLNMLLKSRIDVSFDAEVALSRHLREKHGAAVPLDTLRQLIRKFLE